MFGFVVAHLSTVSEKEKERYHALYCGLCRALKDRYGQASRAVLSYDLTFYVMLANSLHEPPEETGEAHCVTHPAKKMAYARSTWTDYAADLAVALAFHKCLDDVHDDRSTKARAATALLKGAYERAQQNIPDQCAAIERAMASIARIEQGALAQREAASGVAESSPTPDDAANAFGELLGQLFAHNQGIWTCAIRTFGTQLGRFIYLMDAAVDYAADLQTGSYNPFVSLKTSPQDMKTLLSVAIGDAAATFERLPLEQDVHLMRSVLYSGVWQKFNETYGGDATPSGASREQRAQRQA